VPGIFDVEFLPGVPGPAQRAVLLTARRDLDLATAAAARSELFDACAGAGAAVLVDVTGVFVGAALVRGVVQLAEWASRAGKPLVVIGAPPWLVGLAPRLDMPPLTFVTALDPAVSALRAA
jgi:hypothetical protein